MTGFVLKLVPDAEMAALLRDIINRLAVIERNQMNTDEAIVALTEKIAAHGTVLESAVTLITGLSEQMLAAKDDPEQIMALASQVQTMSDTLANAVVANTPAAPPA